MHAIRMFRALAKSQHGNVSMILALALPVVVGGAGLGVETTYWYLSRLKLQTAADAAAYAAASEKAGAGTPSLSTAALGAATENGYSPGSLTVNSPYGSGTDADKTVEVLLTSNAERLFSKIFTSTPVNLSARAVARYRPGAPVCVLALNSYVGQAVSFQGSAGLTLTECNVMANSTAANAVYANGTPDVDVKCISTAGGVSLSSGVTTVCASPQVNVAPVPDPFRAIDPPADPGGACQNVPNGGNNAAHAVTIYPGKYCSLSFKRYINMAPGVYYVEGDVSGSNTPVVTGTGVTIYMASTTGKISMNGTEKLNLTAPTSGAYKGILIYGDRNNNQTHKLNGTADSALTGDIYFKSARVQFNGNFSGTNQCTHIVADTVEWNGTADFKADCTAEGMLSIAGGFTVTMIE